MIYALLIALIALAYCQNCEEQIQFGFSSCKFYVHYDNSTCLDFSFIRCEWTQCVSYVYVNRAPHCIRQITYNDSSWVGCTNKCCNGDMSYPQTYSSITQCQDYLNSRFKLIITIVMSVIGGIILIFCIVCLCCGCCCNCVYNCLERIRNCCVSVFCCCCFRNRVEEQPKPASSNEMKKILRLNLHPNWRFQNLANSTLNTICTICLEEGPSLQLQCGHIFHRQCILTWLQKKHDCTLCRSTEINKINVYCQLCFSSHYETTLNEIQKDFKKKKQICSGCQEADL